MKYALLLAALTVGVGCSSFGRKLDSDKAKALRRVAIVSFEIHQQQPADNLGIGKFKEIKKGRVGDSLELKNMAAEVLAYTNKELAKKTGWRMLSQAELKANSVYAAKYQKTMTGAHHVTMAGDGFERVTADGILNNVNFRKMDHAERVKLAKALGVDGFAEVIIYQNIGQSWYSIGHITGDADFRFTARSNLMAYALDSDDPVWRIQNVDGEESPNSDTLPEEMPKLEKLARLGDQASRSSLKKIFEAYEVQ